MSEIMYTLWAILEKAALVGILLFAFWFTWVVPNDTKRSRNVAMVAMFGILIVGVIFSFREYYIIGDDIHQLKSLTHQGELELDKLYVRKDIHQTELARLEGDLAILLSEKERLSAAIQDSKSDENLISRKYADLRRRIADMDQRLHEFDRSLSAIFFASHSDKLLPVKSQEVVDQMFASLASYDHFNFYQPSHIVNSLVSSQMRLEKRSKELRDELRMIQDSGEQLESDIINLREELSGNIRFVLVSPDKTSRFN